MKIICPTCGLRLVSISGTAGWFSYFCERCEKAPRLSINNGVPFDFETSGSYFFDGGNLRTQGADEFFHSPTESPRAISEVD